MDVLADNHGHQVIHVCGDRELSMYEYAILGGSKVEPITLGEYNGPPLTRRMSLTTKYWKHYSVSTFTSL